MILHWLHNGSQKSWHKYYNGSTGFYTLLRPEIEYDQEAAFGWLKTKILKIKP